MRFAVATLSLCFIVLLVCAGAAELALEQGKAGHNPALLKTAQRLNPWVSRYAYEDYRMTGDLAALRRAMQLEPSLPAYHMYYGLALLKRKPRTLLGDREAAAEICRAANLKPYSAQYKGACEAFKKVIPVDIPEVRKTSAGPTRL